MRIASRRKEATDPLDQATKYLVHCHEDVLQPKLDHVPGSLKMSVMIDCGLVITIIEYVNSHGDHIIHEKIETTDEVMGA